MLGSASYSLVLPVVVFAASELLLLDLVLASDVPLSPLADAASLDEVLASDLAAVVGFDFLALAASFLAQPLPLKWMAGGDSALRMVPPHSAQVSGPRSWMPCMTSSSRPQAEQR
jgi:hypothetical protein